ncbi:hypothetical protein [Breoghania sp.]|uniref:hypothetical protein n=1 Tax=Breoghania sp. TaxID=2065378 RepID=UPI002AAB3C8D|nr:hypothetical protein [Breoghania sp.]
MSSQAHETADHPQVAGATRAARLRRGLTRRWPVLAAGAVLLGLAGCYGASTFYDHRTGWVFDPSGTEYDCAVVASSHAPGSYWRGLAGGRIFLGPHETRNIAREACFPSRGECRYWLEQMRAAMTIVSSAECTRR